MQGCQGLTLESKRVFMIYQNFLSQSLEKKLDTYVNSKEEWMIKIHIFKKIRPNFSFVLEHVVKK